MAHLDLDGPAEVGHVDVEGDVVVESEIKLLTGETVSVLLDVGPRYDGHFLTRDGSSCQRQMMSREEFSVSFAPLASNYSAEQCRNLLALLNPIDVL